MTKFFGRRASVLLQAKGEGAPVPLLPTIPAVAFDGLHVQFRAEKDNLGHPNTLTLSVFNLSAATRARLQGGGGYVRLEAGYQDEAVPDSNGIPHWPVIFEGNARTVDHLRKGPDWVTRIQCGDGELAYRFGFVSQSFAAGTTSAAIAKYLAEQIKAVDPQHIDISGFKAKIPNLAFPLVAFVHGYVAHGNAFEELQKLLGGAYEITLQNGELRALKAQEGTQNVILLDRAHGLIGSPEHGTPNLNGLPSVLKVTALLQPRLTPGDLFQLDAKGTQGTFRVQKITHSGDLGGNDWQSEIEALPLQTAATPAF